MNRTMRKIIRLEQMDVPRPCSIGWSSMQGSDATRLCAVCEREVHDVAAMTRAEAEALLNDRDARICVRLTRGIDGEVVTADRPPAVPQARHWTNLSAAAFAAFFGMAPATTRLSGTVFDQTCEGLPGAAVVAVNEATGKEFTTESDPKGRYKLSLPSGTYLFGVDIPGFRGYTVESLEVGSAPMKVNALLTLPTIGEVVSIPDQSIGGEGRFLSGLWKPFRALTRGPREIAKCGSEAVFEPAKKNPGK